MSEKGHNLYGLLSIKDWKKMFDINRSEINEENLYLLYLISQVFLIVAASLTFATIIMHDLHLIPVWIALFIIMLAFAWACRYMMRHMHVMLAMTVIVLFKTFLFAVSIYTVFVTMPRANVILPVVLLALAPTMFIVSPLTMLVEEVAAVFALVAANMINPHPSLPVAELNINFILVGLGGLFFGMYTEWMKILAIDNARRMREMAKMDMSLNIANRQAFYEDYKDAESIKGIKGIFMVDLNGFKKINDTYGHQFGDECLKIAAASLKDAGSGADTIFYRYGGDEFIGVQMTSSKAGEGQIIEKIRRNLAATPAVITGGGQITISMSIGYSELTENTLAGVENCIHIADVEMYKEKKSFAR